MLSTTYGHADGAIAMAKPPGHSDKIESLAGKTLANPNAGKTAKALAAAVLAHADGKPKGSKR